MPIFRSAGNGGRGQGGRIISRTSGVSTSPSPPSLTGDLNLLFESGFVFQQVFANDFTPELFLVGATS